MTREQQLEKYIDDFQKSLLHLFEVAKQSAAKHDKDLFFAGKFTTMKEVQQIIDRRPVPGKATVQKIEETEEDFSQYL